MGVRVVFQNVGFVDLMMSEKKWWSLVLITRSAMKTSSYIVFSLGIGVSVIPGR